MILSFIPENSDHLRKKTKETAENLKALKMCIKVSPKWSSFGPKLQPSLVDFACSPGVKIILIYIFFYLLFTFTFFYFSDYLQRLGENIMPRYYAVAAGESNVHVKNIYMVEIESLDCLLPFKSVSVGGSYR